MTHGRPPNAWAGFLLWVFSWVIGSTTSKLLILLRYLAFVAEREGFEPPIRLPVCRISSAVHSTTLPPLHRGQDGEQSPRRGRSLSEGRWLKQGFAARGCPAGSARTRVASEIGAESRFPSAGPQAPGACLFLLRFLPVRSVGETRIAESGADREHAPA